MKKLYPLLLASCLVFGVSAVAEAQPPQAAYQVPPVFDYTCPGGQTPELAIKKLFMNAKGPYNQAAKIVEGADPDNPALQRLQNMITTIFEQFSLSPQEIKISPVSLDAELVTARYRLVLYNELGFTIVEDDSAKLRKYVTRKCTYWMIVPNDYSADHQQFFNQYTNDARASFTTRLATLIAYPQKSLTAYDLFQSESNVKQILLGLMQYGLDYDNQINLNPQNFKDGLMPYLKSDAIFTAPGDTKGTVSYDINSNLSGIHIGGIKNLSTLVSIYQGHGEKLDFKYDDHAVVGFMDGHIKSVSPEEAKNLRWKP